MDNKLNIKPYSNNAKKHLNRIIQGDCIKKMKEMKANSVDTIITDPPYDLSTVNRFKAKDSGEKWKVKSGVYHRSSKGFMGKSWDGTQIAFKLETWKEMLRVAKPGATLLSFGGTRTYHRMACAIEDAGWILKDCIMWLYGSGFPKATDISKQLDKKAGKKGKLIRKEKLAGTAATLKGKANRENWYDQGKGGTFTPELEIREPATPEAKLWNGWKSHGLKPAYEPIIVAMKPNDGSYANNTKHGVSGLNIDGGRINYQDNKDKESARWGNDNNARKTLYKGGFTPQGKNLIADNKGRFPANIILNEEAAKMLDEQSGVSKSGIPKGIGSKSGGIWQKSTGQPAGQEYGDKGGASRFFYVAKASKSERNMGCEGLEKKQTTGGGGGIGDYKDDVNSMSGKYGSEKAPATINHPTVKPLKLMEYLCTLTKTPTGGIVLDPFIGSGTTGIACINTERYFIGIEKEKEYIKIAKARIKEAEKIKKEKDCQRKLF